MPLTSKLCRVVVYRPLLLLFTAHPVTRVIIFRHSSGIPVEVDHRLSIENFQCSQHHPVQTIKLFVLLNTTKLRDQMFSAPGLSESVLGPEMDCGFSSLFASSITFNETKR